MRLLPAALISGLVALGCGPQTGSDDGFEPPGESPVPYDPSTEIAYPPAPYGIEKDSVITDYEFQGFVNPERLPKVLETIRLSDFYNPTGTDTYPPGSVHPEGEPKPRALLIVMSAVWCQPCQLEADKTLPDKHEEFFPGGEFLLVLADSQSTGVPADETDLSNWTSKFTTDFPAVIDPEYNLGKQFPGTAYPANMIVDTKTMTIVEKITGQAPEDGSFWATFASASQ